MLTNTLLLYMTQEALAKARDRLSTRKDASSEDHTSHNQPVQPAWQTPRGGQAKPRPSLRH